MSQNAFILTILIFFSSTCLLIGQDFSFIIDISEYKKNKTEAQEKNSIYYGMKGDQVVLKPMSDDGSDTRILFNRSDKSMIILNDDSDSKMAMKMKMQDQDEVEYNYDEYETDEVDLPKLNKTGKTETIDNFLCHQFISVDEDGTTELWLTTKLPVSFYQLMDFYGMNSGPKNQKKESSSDFLPLEFRKYGFPIKIINTDTDGNKSVMLFNNIKESVDANYFDTSGFKIQDMSKFQFNYQTK